jgi:hypothetical protein
MEVLNPASYYVNVYAIPTFLTAVVLLFLAVLVLIRERGSVVGFVFGLMTIAVSVWLLAFSWMYSAANETVAFW